MFSIIKMKYKAKKITAAEVWYYADQGKITEAEALLICGPRPRE